ncbi:clarin-3-like isoform x1 [Plakobranchus ocellatus]|uniref:Clarin-3-like isoform x1 n=1 Tax=Plakobranchus ocellatus TaxID=259542 RepID=A0AAV4AHV4_9GAST|nr:clarin-3-like isoform x1 [Plakobranchus ocellatus]
MVTAQRRWIGVSVFVAVIGVGFIVAAFATDHWIVSEPKGNATNQNSTGGSSSRYTANITFGLFTGSSHIDYGLGIRSENLILKCNVSEEVCAYVDKLIPSEDLRLMIETYKNQTDGTHLDEHWFGLFSFPLFVATLLMLVLAVVWGLVAIGFGIFNVFGRPIETITGPTGLYAWNSLALIFSLAAVGVYLGLFFSQFEENILQESDLRRGFTSDGLTDLDYSFYFVVGAVAAFFVNVVILIISDRKCSCSFSRSAEKEVDNGMILY